MRGFLQRLFRIAPEARLAILMVLIVGPLAGLGRVYPTPMIRWMVFGVLAMFAALFAVLIYYRLQARSQGRRLDREISEQSGGPSRRELAEKDREYRKKWLEGIEKLNKANISLYDLPWYVIVGEPGGGKTMTLLNSGMDFPMGKDELPGFGGTRNYNWWFTNTAVILDTAGRLVFEQEGTSDRHEWEAFLKMLRRRRRCPINGLVVALPADKLMSDSAEQRERSASVIRERLRQIQNILDVRFPVFLLVTKADLIAGFTEFFNELDGLQRNQLFGFSRPGNFDTAYDPTAFSEEFETLYRRLHDVRLHFLNRQASDVELGWVHTYPEAFRTLKDRIQDYIDVIFSKNIFAEPLFFRGFYFTSALQEGTPFLDILGQHLSDEGLESLEGIFPQSRAFFIHDFYTRKVAREQGMVFRSQKHINRMRLLKRSTFLVGIPMFILMSFLTTLGYFAYQSAVGTPVATIRDAETLMQDRRAAQQDKRQWSVDSSGDGSSMARALDMVTELDRAIERFRNPSGTARLMFGSISNKAERDIRRVQRELTGYCIVRPVVAEVEAALAETGVALTPANIDDFQASFGVYLDWHYGRQRGSLDALRRILPSASYARPGMSDVLERFASVQGGRLAGGLTSDTAHHRDVIDSALERAQQYWLSTTDILQHPEFEWWRRLFELCESVRTSYRALLGDYRRFEGVAGRREFVQAVEAWMEQFPPGATDGDLLAVLREHRRNAPRLSAGIEDPGEKMKTLVTDAERFWQAIQASLPDPAEGLSDTLTAEAAVLEQRIDGYITALGRERDTRLQDLRTRLTAIETVVRQSDDYAIVDAAEAATGALREQVYLRLQNLDSPLPASIDRWVVEIQRVVDQQQIETAFELGPDWDEAGLRQLIQSVESARRLFQGRQVLNDIASLLAGSGGVGMARFVDGYDEDTFTTALRFPGLFNRHAEPFMRRVLNGRRELEQLLARAAQAGVMPDSVEIQPLLDQALRAYLQDYLESWSSSYSRQRFTQINEFNRDKPSSWETYRNWILENGNELQRSYHDHLTAIVDHVIKPLRNPALSTALSGVDWPRDSRLQPLVAKLNASADMPEARGATTAWNQFVTQVEDFRYRGIDELSRERIEFPQLGRDTVLSADWLTQQMQFIVDYGNWQLWDDIRGSLLERLAPFDSRRPFIFENGRAPADPLALVAMLDGVHRIQQFGQAQPGAAARVAPELTAWVDQAGAWRTFIRQSEYTLEIEHKPQETGSGRRGTADFYKQVVLILPGLSNSSGDPLERMTFDAAASRPPQRIRWQPTQGSVVIAMRGVNPNLNLDNAPLQPRLLEVPRQDYPVVRFLQQYGSRETDGWRVEVSKNMQDIQGLGQVPADSATRWVTLRVRFVEPETGLPAVLAWPQASELGSRPQAPWRSN